MYQIIQVDLTRDGLNKKNKTPQRLLWGKRERKGERDRKREEERVSRPSGLYSAKAQLMRVCFIL